MIGLFLLRTEGRGRDRFGRLQILLRTRWNGKESTSRSSPLLYVLILHVEGYS